MHYWGEVHEIKAEYFALNQSLIILNVISVQQMFLESHGFRPGTVWDKAFHQYWDAAYSRVEAELKHLYPYVKIDRANGTHL